MKKSGWSSGVFDTKRHSNVKSKPEYRRVRKYYKSAEKWRLERERRRRVLELREKGLSYADIAWRLGACERTVRRDMARIRPYYERLVRNYWNRLEEENRAKVEALLQGKTLLERYRVLGKMLAEQTRLLKQREYLSRKVTITIDLDQLTGGYPTLKICPQPPVSVKSPLLIELWFVKDGKKQSGVCLQIGSSSTR